jgi:hypothetical protein
MWVDDMTASNTNAAGMSLAAIEPMLPVPGPNLSSNTQALPNVANYFCCGGNEQNMATIRPATSSQGGLLGIASGTHSSRLVPSQGSTKYFIQGAPATRLGDLSMTNAGNAASTQLVPSQTTYFINA